MSTLISTVKSTLFLDTNSEIPVVMAEDGSVRTLEVGDVLFYSVSDGWNGSSGVESTVTKITDRSITSIANGYRSTNHRLNIERLPLADFTPGAEKPSSYQYGRKQVYVVDADVAAAAYAEQKAKQARRSALDAKTSAGNHLAATTAARDYQIRDAGRAAIHKAREIVMDRYAYEIVAEEARVLAGLLAEIEAQSPAVSAWVVTFEPNRPLAFETEQDALDYIAEYIEVYSADASRFGTPTYQTV